MHWENPLGLLLLMFVPLILVIHWYRSRSPRRRIAGVFLWAKIGARVLAESSWSSRAAHAALDCAAIAMLALVASGLRVGSGVAGETNWLTSLLRTILCLGAVGAVGLTWRRNNQAGGSVQRPTTTA